MADALVLFGVLVMTLGVYGVVRMPDTYTTATLKTVDPKHGIRSAQRSALRLG
jgi:multisubunit Na+/H+ antiporter MnhG subunit